MEYVRRIDRMTRELQIFDNSKLAAIYVGLAALIVLGELAS